MADMNVELQSWLSKTLEQAHPDVLREMLHMILSFLMDRDVAAACGAEYGEHSEERTNHRNGYRDRPFETRLGTMNLRIPKLREGSYFPPFLEVRRRWEKAFVNVVTEAYVKGVSTRKVEELVEAMGAKGMSKSQVSRMAKNLDERVEEFRNRPLDEHVYPYVWLDALYVKVRHNGRVVNRAVLVAYGVTEEGRREVLGVTTAAGEMESSWREFLGNLTDRGLSGVKLVISDAHEGLQKAIRKVLNGVTWQRCYVHFKRNVIERVPQSISDKVTDALGDIFEQPTRTEASERIGELIEMLEPDHEAAARIVREAEMDVLAYMDFPEVHWPHIRSTNMAECINKQIRRRTRVVGIFPNDEALLRLVGTLLVEQHEEWMVGQRYMGHDSMQEVCEMDEEVMLKEPF